ncbi:MAG: sigma-54-dependent transcriptional regulator [Bryobacteraceae bacterium]
MQKLLVVEDDSSVRTTIVTCLEMEGYAVDAVASTDEAMERLGMESYPIVISDIYIDARTGLDVLEAAKRKDPTCSVILMTARGTMETVMAATRGGAFDYIAKPFDLDRMVETVKRAEASRTQEDEIEHEELPETEMIGSSSGIVELYKTVSRVAPTDATVLIEGETGTGKELVARMIHRHSGNRSSQPFVPVDCASIAPALLESELFGTLKGAYTGADRDRVGVLEAANNGTVFLDEIGEVDFNFQQRLLRFMQEREVRPLGASKGRPVDVRVIAATNRDLQKLVEEKKFREDLWFRMNNFRLVLPPLRERRGDVTLLARFYLSKYNARYSKDIKLTESGLKAMEEYTWPGNVRQLQHLIERLTILTSGERIDGETVRDALASMEPKEHGGETLADAESEQIKKVLAATGGNKSRAAQILGIERKTLYRKLDRMK